VSILDTLFDAVGIRRRKQIDELTAKRAGLVSEHLTAVSAGDDAAADRVHKKIRAIDEEIAAAQAAIEVAQKLAAQREQVDSAANGARLKAEAEAAMAAASEEAVRFDEILNGELLAQWAHFQQAHAEARRRCVAAGMDINAHRVLVPSNVWRRAFVRFGQAVQIEIPRGAPASHQIASVAEALADARAGADSRNVEEIR
jgi:hypothetical protein